MYKSHPQADGAEGGLGGAAYDMSPAKAGYINSGRNRARMRKRLGANEKTLCPFAQLSVGFVVKSERVAVHLLETTMPYGFVRFTCAECAKVFNDLVSTT